MSLVYNWRQVIRRAWSVRLAVLAGVLTPLHAPGLFAVVDRIGTTPNLQEFRYPRPFTVRAPG